MVRLALVIPCKDYIPNALETFRQYMELSRSDREEPMLLQEVVTEIDQVKRQEHWDYDVIIARGLMAEAIKQKHPGISIIEIPMVGTDLLHALMECRQRYGSRKIAIIAAGNMTSGAESFSKIVGACIRTFNITDSQSRNKMIERAIESGCDAILGGFTTCGIVKKLGVNSVCITTGPDTFWQCLTEARRLAQLSRREQEKTQRIAAILDYSQEGIIALDSDKRILMINKQAELILGLGRRVLYGDRISGLPVPRALLSRMLDNRDYYNEVLDCGEMLLNVNKVAVLVKQRPTGCVITFQRANNIMELETKIRNKIYSKGHTAKRTFDDIVGGSAPIRKAIDIARHYAETNSTILLLGRSGTGKEIFAQSIHNESARSKGAFVAVNCAALPEQLLESELFGYVDGAFTGAAKDGKAGFFELAHEGTLFLDEIGEMPLALQAKLLRVIQEREVVRLGDSQVRAVNVRLICATNRDLEEQVREGTFREDLYYRLHVLSLTIPELSRRKEDIPLLVDFYLHKEYPRIAMDAGAKELMTRFDWPGNVRQLFNLCERLAVLCEKDRITAADVQNAMDPPRIPLSTAAETAGAPLPDAGDEERVRILQALEEARFNRGKAAGLLGIDRSTLWRKMKTYGL